MDLVEKFQNKIYNEYKKYKIGSKKLTFNQICWPIKYAYQLPQLFVSQFINPKTQYKSLLIYHKIGAGKTCAAVQIAEQWKTKKNVILICPASLVNNFYKEFRTECTGIEYVSIMERKKLNKLDPLSVEYKQMITIINKRIDEYYHIYSYNKFINLIKQKKLKLDNSLLIIDEVQNIVSEQGPTYQIILNAIKNTSDDTRIVIMSGTPIFDKPMEIGLTLNLLKPLSEFEIGKKFNETYINDKVIDKMHHYKIKNIQKLRLKLNGLVSYYQGAPDYTFPKEIRKIIKCPMSSYQYECYKEIIEHEGDIDKFDLLKLPNNFFIGSRIISNIAFPNKLVNLEGYNALTNKMMGLNNIQTYSTKYYEILKRILNKQGPIFIYSNFKEYGGLLTLIKILEYHKFSNFTKNGSGRLRYAIWSGDESFEQKEQLKNVFNSKENHNGSQIKIILGSPAIKEGVSLLRVKYVHIIEPYWNLSRLEQVIGRAVRFCSHKDVEEDKRIVKVYIYLATLPTDIVEKEKQTILDKNNYTITIDEHIYNMAITKAKLISKFENVIKSTAIDYKLFQ